MNTRYGLYRNQLSNYLLSRPEHHLSRRLLILSLIHLKHVSVMGTRTAFAKTTGSLGDAVSDEEDELSG